MINLRDVSWKLRWAVRDVVMKLVHFVGELLQGIQRFAHWLRDAYASAEAGVVNFLYNAADAASNILLFLVLSLLGLIPALVTWRWLGGGVFLYCLSALAFIGWVLVMVRSVLEAPPTPLPIENSRRVDGRKFIIRCLVRLTMILLFLSPLYLWLPNSESGNFFGLLRRQGDSGPAKGGPRTPVVSNPYVTLSGLGPVVVGMTLQEGSKALGRPLVRTEKWPSASEACFYVEPQGGPPDVGFMVLDQRIARVDISNQETTTIRGAKNGDSEERILKLFPGRITIREHKYNEKGHYLIYEDPEVAALAIVFETDGEKVFTFRSGRLPEVTAVEHCL